MKLILCNYPCGKEVSNIVLSCTVTDWANAMGEVKASKCRLGRGDLSSMCQIFLLIWLSYSVTKRISML